MYCCSQEVQSDYPCPLGLTVSGVKGNRFTANGERYAEIILPGTSNNTKRCLANPSPYINSAYLSMFPGMTRDKLRSHGVLDVPDEPYKFVDRRHPVVAMMKENNESLQVMARFFISLHLCVLVSYVSAMYLRFPPKNKMRADGHWRMRSHRWTLDQGGHQRLRKVHAVTGQGAREQPAFDQPEQVQRQGASFTPIVPLCCVSGTYLKKKCV